MEIWGGEDRKIIIYIVVINVQLINESNESNARIGFNQDIALDFYKKDLFERKNFY